MCAVIIVASILAAALGRPAWAAALGAGLVLASWALERLTWRRGEAAGTFGGAIGVALGGMMVRMAVVLTALAVVGLAADKAAFTTAALAFLAAFTLYLPLRFLTYPPLEARRQAGVHP